MSIHAFGIRYTVRLETRRITYRRNRRVHPFGRSGADRAALAGVLCAALTLAVALATIVGG